MLNEYEDILEPEDLRTIFGIGRNKVYELLKTNAIKSIRIGKKYRITRDAVQQFIYEQNYNCKVPTPPYRPD